jgi:hypothetical protein
MFHPVQEENHYLRQMFHPVQEENYYLWQMFSLF